MNIVFIWDGFQAPLYEMRTRCVRRAMDIYSEAKFTCITTLKEFFLINIINTYDYYEKIKHYDIDVNKYMNFSDYARFHYLSEHEDTLYLDTDIWCTKPIKLTEECKATDIQAIWSGKDCNGIKEIFSKHDNRIILHHLRNKFKNDNDFNECFQHKPKWLRKECGIY